MSKEYSYIGFDNAQLKDCVSVKKGYLVECRNCGGVHSIEYGTSEGKETSMIGYFVCGDKTFLASIHDKLIMGIKPAASGKLSL